MIENKKKIIKRIEKLYEIIIINFLFLNLYKYKIRMKRNSLYFLSALSLFIIFLFFLEEEKKR